jgi:hypothetical protein
MGDLVDLDAFRKRKEEEERAKEKAELEKQAKEDAADIEYMQSVLNKIMVSLSSIMTGSGVEYTMDGQPYSYYPSGGLDNYGTYYHEAGYDDDGYYENTWYPEDEDDEDF